MLLRIVSVLVDAGLSNQLTLHGAIEQAEGVGRPEAGIPGNSVRPGALSERQRAHLQVLQSSFGVRVVDYDIKQLLRPRVVSHISNNKVSCSPEVTKRLAYVEVEPRSNALEHISSFFGYRDFNTKPRSAYITNSPVFAPRA